MSLEKKQIGGYLIDDGPHLGEGHNTKVVLAADGSGNKVAIKIINKGALSELSKKLLEQDEMDVDEAKPNGIKKSAKARGKMPVGQPAFSRQNSTTSLNSMATPNLGANEFFSPSTAWVCGPVPPSVKANITKIESWLPELPLHTLLMLITELAPKIPSTGGSNDTVAALKVIQESEVRGIEPAPIRVHLFEWSPVSLGW